VIEDDREHGEGANAVDVRAIAFGHATRLAEDVDPE
jgi:hypothetical protein